MTSFKEKVEMLKWQMKLLGLDGDMQLTVHRKGQIVDFEMMLERESDIFRSLWLAIGVAGFSVMAGCGRSIGVMLEYLLVDFEGWGELGWSRQEEVWDYVGNIREGTNYLENNDMGKDNIALVKKRNNIFG